MGSTLKPYIELEDFSSYYLEDSWVLGVEAHPGSLEFRLDLVLTPEHAAYAAPRPGEVYCYRHGRLRFLDVKRLIWDDQGAPPAIDASGELDYGNIDSFEWEDGRFILEGGWGKVEIQAGTVQIELEEDGMGGREDVESNN
ncbi:MAG: hypothetical protein ACYDHO_04305 [Gaiellaceae bacterium]